MTSAAAPQSVVELFVQEAAAAGASVHGPAANAEAIALVASIVGQSGGSGVLSWTPDALGIGNAWELLETAGITVTCSEVPAGRQERLETLAAMDDLQVGLTSVVGALADTGTLVLASGPGRPRLAWLLPAHHVALVPTSTVRPDMASFFADPTRVSPDTVAHLAFVTGPSRSADIELTLTRGVHGPKTVHIILLQA